MTTNPLNRIRYARKAAQLAELRWLAAWERLEYESAERWARTGQIALANLHRLEAEGSR